MTPKPSPIRSGIEAATAILVVAAIVIIGFAAIVRTAWWILP